MATLVRHESRDIDDQAQSLAGWEQSYEQLGYGRFCGSVWQLVMNDGVLLRETSNRQHRQQFVPPRGHVVLAMALSVESGSAFNGRPIAPNSLVVFDSRSQHEAIYSGEIELIVLSVDSAVLETALAPEKLEWLKRMALNHQVDLPPDTATAIRQLLLAACDDGERQLHGQSDPEQENELLSSSLSHAVMLAMTSENDAMPSTIPRRTETRLKVVKRAVEFMRANLHDDIGVTEICGAAYTSRRTLHYCFEEFMRTTPQAYFRALRLNEARRSLKLHAGLPITELACTLGFANASHFTRHYKLMFDELPSETLKRNSRGQLVA